ncbi:MAG: hypothetical protein A2428_09545 [Bdellovibrionales bacterium RIFOXYC1_FULL_54_43]|nr:MAG: hypothetical protein A2428_09545 [Bdellovibrionales bacterium RIFOXYC1_FULL_54_43]OFZ84206.1 MAG: hypothetical protein A2603_14615 [Bdellovibrionales bacterium RIFOXYD1_FULL_55_31]
MGSAPFGRSKFGGVPAIVGEHFLTVTRAYPMKGRRERIVIDPAELAKLRRSGEWTIERLAARFGVGTTALKK